MKRGILICLLLCSWGTILIALSSIFQEVRSESPPPAMIRAAPKEPLYMQYIPEYEAERVSDAIAENIVRRIDLYAGDSTKPPDMTIYHYENLPTALRKEQDRYVLDQFNVRWDELPDDVKKKFNRLLELKGEYAENKLVVCIASRAAENFRLELRTYKHSFKTWSKAMIAETFTAGMLTIDPQTGEAVDKYDNILEAYGGFFVSNIGKMIGLGGLFEKIGTFFTSKMYDKMVISEPTRKKSVEKLERKFSRVAVKADARSNVLDDSAFQLNSIRAAESRLISAIRAAKKQRLPYGHLIFVVDSSGSMSKTDPRRVRISGLKILLHRLRKDTSVSVIDFDHGTKVVAAHLNARTELEDLKKGLNSIDSDGNTHIGKGLREAISIAKNYDDKAIIFLLTDGKDNGKEDILGIAKSVSGSIPIYTIGLTGAVNEQLLSQIADITYGRYFKAASSRHLFGKLNTILSETIQEATLLSFNDLILMGEVHEKIFTIDTSVSGFSIINSWAGSRIDLEIVRPDGQVITAKDAARFGMKYFQGANTIIAISDTAEVGEWKLRLLGTDIPSGGERYSCSVEAISDLLPQMKIRNLYTPGSSVPISVYLDKDKVIQYDVHTTVEDPTGKQQEIKGSEIYRAVVDGDYKVTCSISGYLNDGQKFIRIMSKEFHVGLPDSKSLVIPAISMVMRWIPSGSFIMGDDEGKADEKPAHELNITKGFWMAECEVTQSMWEKIMGDNPLIFKSVGSYPVEGVNYDDCQLFLEKLSAISGMKCRLPTEAEWEYACRAGTPTKYSWGDEIFSDHVRIDDEWSLGPSPVKMFSPNRWGLFDMHSNVWEWCSDWYVEDYYAKSSPKDPIGFKEGTYRVARGGAWSYGADDMRSAKRTAVFPGRRLGNLGFRVVISEKK